MKSAINTLLTLLALFVAVFLISPVVRAADGPNCAALAGHVTDTKQWNQVLYGNDPYICVNKCEYITRRKDGEPNLTLCMGREDHHLCHSKFISTGNMCPQNGFFPGGDFPEENGPDSNGDGIPDEIEFLSTIRPIEYKADVACNDYESCKFVHSAVKGIAGALNEDETLDRIRTSLYHLHMEHRSIIKDVSDHVSLTLDAHLSGLNTGGDGGVSGGADVTELGETVNTNHEDYVRRFDRLQSSVWNVERLVSINEPKFREIYSWMLDNASTNSFVRTNSDGIKAVDKKLRSQTLQMNHFASSLADLKAGLESGQYLGSGGSVDLSPVENSLSGLSSDIAGLSSDVQGLDDGLGRLGESMGRVEGLLSGDGLVSRNGKGVGLVNFGDGYLVSDSSMSAVKKDIESLEGQAVEYRDKFKSLLGFDESSLNNGVYQDHTLDLFVNGKTQSFTSGVFPALVANAGLISSVVILLAVLAGIRLLGKD